ncbi:hypothetical protein MHU86_1368 [Fragilaria crotonensis]|nr:hypothetical protein MHU86_1368 [Fragilaria crotonensis]
MVVSHLMLQCHAACTVTNRFIGRDSGIVLPVAFKYDVTVKAGTTQRVLNGTIIPALEKALATKSAPNLIVACAPTWKDTSKFSDIVGIDLNPKDVLVGNCTSKVSNCYTVHSEVILYTKSTNKGANVTYLIAVGTLITSKALVVGGVVNPSIVSLGNMKSAKTITRSVVSTRKPTRRPTKLWTLSPKTAPPYNTSQPTTAPAPNGNIVQQKINELRRDNPKAFIGMIVGIVVGSLLLIACGVTCGCFAEQYTVVDRRGRRVGKAYR